MKKKFFPVIFAVLSLLSCKSDLNNCSPIIAEVEILDNNNNVLKDVTFSATLDEKPFSGFSYEGKEITDERNQSSQKQLGFIRGTYTYQLCSTAFSTLTDSTLKSGGKMDELYSRIEITIAKPGYKTKKVTPCANHGDCCYMSVVLEETE